MFRCGNISKSLILATCGSSTAKIDSEIILGNHDDIDKEGSQVDGNICAELMLKKAGGGAFRYSTHRNAAESDCTLSKGTYINAFDHKIVVRIFSKSQDVKDELNKLAQGKVFAIVKNLDSSNPETRYEVHGYDNGLVMTDFQAASTNTDGVIYTFTLASDDGAKEAQLPLSLYAGTVETTETMVKGLVKETA